MFIEAGLSLTTLLYTGLDFSIGGRIPISEMHEGNAYFHLLCGPGFNTVPVINSSGAIHEPHIKLMFSIGYKHIFYLHDQIGLQAGLELGGGLFFHYYMISTGKEDKTVTGYYPAYPTMFIKLPVFMELMPKRRVSLLVGVAPVLRFIWNIHYNQSLFRDYPLWENSDLNYELTRGYDSPLRQRIRAGNNMVTMELFFYDMPLTIAARIKI